MPAKCSYIRFSHRGWTIPFGHGCQPLCSGESSEPTPGGSGGGDHLCQPKSLLFSVIQTYVDSHCGMRLPNDADRSDPRDLLSLGVVDLDLSISPDAFGLQAFDVSKPLTRMLPGSSPNELHLMIPDLGIAPEGFHDVVIENLAASPTWRSRHISPGMSLRSADGG